MKTQLQKEAGWLMCLGFWTAVFMIILNALTIIILKKYDPMDMMLALFVMIMFRNKARVWRE